MKKQIPDILCPNCGRAHLHRADITAKAVARGESFMVDCEGLKCSSCDYQTVGAGQLDCYLQATANAYRTKHGLLTGPEIVALRKRLGWTQSDAANYLRVGIASLKRWEGAQIQDESMDKLLRLCLDESAAERNWLSLSARMHRLSASPAPIPFSQGEQKFNYSAWLEDDGHPKKGSHLKQ
jgi:HTH-type transcriptional regulator / antitoxin MqsA